MKTYTVISCRTVISFEWKCRPCLCSNNWIWKEIWCSKNLF